MAPKITETQRKARQDEILDAALICFSRSGLEQATLRDISAQSGLSLGTLYHYFPTKDSLIAGIQERDLASEDSELWTTAPDPETADWTEHHTRFTYERLGAPASRDANRVAVMFWTHALLDEPTRVAQLESLQRAKEETVRSIRAQQAAGLVNPELDAEYVYYAILAMVIGFVTQKNWEPEIDAGKAADVVQALLTGTYWTGVSHGDD